MADFYSNRPFLYVIFKMLDYLTQFSVVEYTFKFDYVQKSTYCNQKSDLMGEYFAFHLTKYYIWPTSNLI